MQRTSDPPASVALPGRKIRFADQVTQNGDVEIAVETPISIVYATMPYAVMMASPADLADFVTGFSLTESIIARADDIRALKIRAEADGLVADVDLVPSRLRAHLVRRRRNFTGRTSCGLCGIETIDDLPLARDTISPAPPVHAAAIARALAELDAKQPLNHLTRAVHAAAWCDRDGQILTTREDVGRHNALDKLIGARARQNCDRRGFVLVTSRASFEMVEKAAIFGTSTLVAISAPTSLAIDRARALGLTLVAVARPDAATVFTGSLAHAVPGLTG